MKESNISQRLAYVLKENGMKQIDLVNKCQPYCLQYNVKMGRNDVSQYLSGKVKPNQWKLDILSKALNVSPVWLMGYDVPMHDLSDNDINKITSQEFISEVMPMIDKIENLNDNQKEMLKMNLQYICKDEESEKK